MLEDLIGSDGWRVFIRYVAREWKGGGYYARMNEVLNSQKPDEAMVIHRCSKEILAVVTWPERRIVDLQEPSK